VATKTQSAPNAQFLDTFKLDDIAGDLGTDKSTRCRLPPTQDGYSARAASGHGYTIYYDYYLRSLSTEPISLLEIGVLDGKSLATWNKFFAAASVYGLDIDPACRRFENDRTKVIIGSQADAGVLADVCRQVPEGFDVIIDDGSHYVKDVIASFQGLFDHLKLGGIYVIEDLNIAAWRDWGRVSFNRGMELHQDSQGNDPAEMYRFLTGVRERQDVAELTVHLKKICFIRKVAETGAAGRSPWERGDALEDLFPSPRKRTLLQKVAVKLLGEF